MTNFEVHHFRDTGWKSRSRRNYLRCIVPDVYGLTSRQYEQLFKDQKGLCAVCRRDPDEFGRFVVDHDHETGKVRGLLCPRCNHLLGRARDNLDILRNAVEYLERFAKMKGKQGRGEAPR